MTGQKKGLAPFQDLPSVSGDSAGGRAERNIATLVGIEAMT